MTSAVFTLSSCANQTTLQLPLLQSIDLLVQVQNDVGTVTDVKSVISLDAMGLEIIELLEEGWNVDDGAGSNEVDAALVDEAKTTGYHMVVEGLAVCNDGLFFFVSVCLQSIRVFVHGQHCFHL
jgi:hypothetical protein